MVRSLASAAAASLAAAAALLLTTASASAPTCGPNNPCPADSPCCSQYGQCGVGAYCLGGCDPIFSHQLDSCVPAPVCDGSKFNIDNLNGVTDIAKYLGDASTANWVSSGSPLEYNGGVLLTLSQGSVGTLLASTHYVWYGKISAKLRTSQGAGVVTAFILMSDVKDEIDFEFIGTTLNQAQSNYYWQGVLDYENGGKHDTSNTFDNEHEYEIDWQPDTLTWSIDGKVVRTLKKSDTWNATTGSFMYPQTPSRVQLSLWPAGLASNGKGTIEWAGGLINWSAGSPAMQNGYYYASVSSVDVTCYDPPSGANKTGDKTYVYNALAGTNNSIAITDTSVILGSLQGTGEEPDKGKAKASGTASAPSSSSSTSVPESVPGVSGGGNSDPNASGSSDQGGAGAGNSSNGGSGGSGSSGTGFSQGGGASGASGNNSGAAVARPEGIVGGSVFALVACVGAMLVL
ncbi:cell wall glucanase [Phyllosticta citribraziliensis]|uniref:Crh-like protein n=1 Tax=Phyllosticta citribraziliensis TaxID=989973 RepID=A0ABR1LQT6_9PEZI